VSSRQGELRLRASIFLRCLFVQASWNFERLQNIGFASMVHPFLARRYGSSAKELDRAVGRHLDFFNTHPFFAGLVAAAVAGEEGGERDRGSFLRDLKHSLMGTLGSLGDSLFWATLRPLAVLAALLPALFGIPWAPVVVLVLFGLPSLAFRWWAIGEGLREGCGVIRSIQRLEIPAKVELLTPAVAVLAGLCAGAAAGREGWTPVPGRTVLAFAAAAALFGLGMAASSRNFSLGARGAATGVFLILLGVAAP
jgi:mannose/fructose/N-acetylgalactosamine-specific phosphotransferase system component IID